jgi:hypothetical protein
MAEYRHNFPPDALPRPILNLQRNPATIGRVGNRALGLAESDVALRVLPFVLSVFHGKALLFL